MFHFIVDSFFMLSVFFAVKP